MAPFYRRLAQSDELDVTVLYCSEFGTGTALDQRPTTNFGRSVTWDIDAYSGYRSKLIWGPVAAHPQRRWTVLAPGLAKELRPDAYDAVVVYGWAYPSHWLAFLLSRLRHIPFLIYGDTNVRDSGSFLPTPARRAVLGTLFRQSAGALYTGTFNRDFYIRYGMEPEDLWFSPYAIDSERFAAGDRDATRTRLGLRDDVSYFLFVGTLIPRKRPLSVLAAVAELQRRGRRVGAVFVGTGELGTRLDEQVSDLGVTDVHALGFVNQTELPDIYAAADALVLPSGKDPRATVVNEAMAAGRPVVISNGTGVWGPGDLVSHGMQGLVFDDGDERALIEACDVLTDRDRRERMGSAAAKRAGEWSFDVAARGWEEAVDTVTRRQRVD